jgi:hypothetical protein
LASWAGGLDAGAEVGGGRPAVLHVEGQPSGQAGGLARDGAELSLHSWLEGALEESGQGVEVTGDRAKQRSRADLGLQAFEADGDVLKLTDRLAVDSAAS